MGKNRIRPVICRPGGDFAPAIERHHIIRGQGDRATGIKPSQPSIFSKNQRPTAMHGKRSIGSADLDQPGALDGMGRGNAQAGPIRQCFDRCAAVYEQAGWTGQICIRGGNEGIRAPRIAHRGRNIKPQRGLCLKPAGNHHLFRHFDIKLIRT